MRKWQIPLNLILAFVFLSGLVGLGISPSADSQGTLHPALVQAAAGPEQQVHVIVQKTEATGQVEDLVSALGGTVVKDLHIINAFAAELPASALLELAKSDGVRWVAPDAPLMTSDSDDDDDDDDDGQCGDDLEDCPPNHYLDTLGVRQVWEMGLNGRGIAVAVIDSGINRDRDFLGRLRARRNFYSNRWNVNDSFGHGTHVAGIIGGSGADSDGLYTGIAPRVKLIGLKIGDEGGMAYESDAVEAMQWVLEHKDRYNIRVVNLSINSTVEDSYHNSPLGAAAEILWFNSVVVVASAGNTSKDYNTINAAPASDPFIITVGAANEKGDSNPENDTVASFSPSGITRDFFTKPDIVAPGQGIVSVLSRRSDWDEEYPDRVVYDGQYFRLSGTSMSAPMVAGAVALLLQDEPDLTPDQVKYRLLTSATRSFYDPVDDQTYPYLDVYAAVTADTDGSLNTGLEASQLLWTGDEPVEWDSVNWNSVNWNSVNWNSVNWNSVNWNSVNWNSVAWND